MWDLTFFGVILGIGAENRGGKREFRLRVGAGLRVFFRVGMQDWQGKQRDTGFKFQRDFAVIGHFRITLGLFFKASPGVHPFI